jgi:beta-lactam-binding protein with PASTA domain
MSEQYWSGKNKSDDGEPKAFEKAIHERVAFKEYLLSKEFLFTIGIIITSVLVLFFALFFVVLPLLTRHGASTVIPSVSLRSAKKGGYTSLEEAIDKITEAGLQAVIKDCVYVAGLPPGVVIEQEPVGNTIVKPGRKVLLVISKKIPQSVKFPEIIGRPISEAKQNLLNWDFKIGKLIEVYAQDDQVIEAFYKQRSLKAGDPVPKGAVIDIKFGKIINKNVFLPDVTGLTLDEAINKLALVGLSAKVAKIEFGTRQPPNIVLKQDPSPNRNRDSVLIGSSIDLWISGEANNLPIEGLPAE